MLRNCTSQIIECLSYYYFFVVVVVVVVVVVFSYPSCSTSVARLLLLYVISHYVLKFSLCRIDLYRVLLIL